MLDPVAQSAGSDGSPDDGNAVDQIQPVAQGGGTDSGPQVDPNTGLPITGGGSTAVSMADPGTATNPSAGAINSLAPQPLQSFGPLAQVAPTYADPGQSQAAYAQA